MKDVIFRNNDESIYANETYRIRKDIRSLL